MAHLGINLGHDRSVAVVSDGKIQIAIEQERLDRIKHSVGFLNQSVGDMSKIELPSQAIKYCMDALGIKWSNIQSITANMPGIDHSLEILKSSLPSSVHSKIHQIPSHHLSHAYSAFWPSNFEEAIILSIDASGSAGNGTTESFSLYTGRGSTIELLHSEKVTSHLAALSTLGFLYEFISKEADFVSNISELLQIAESGKLMGLSAFGRKQKNWNNWIETTPGSFELKINSYDIALEVECLRKLFDDNSSDSKSYLKPYIVDLSYKIQSELEDTMTHLIRTAIEKTGIRKVCLAGGVALNSVANYKVLQELDIEDIFIFPAAGDNGIAAGNALWAYHTIEKGTLRSELNSASLGVKYTHNLVQSSIEAFDRDIICKRLSEREMLKCCAESLAKGSIVARFEGGSEFGPRALGNRSILADPALNRMKDVLNYRVKFRESFRPFAPVVPLDEMNEVFELETPSPFMLLVAKIRKKYHDILPAITHRDGTGRVQTVDKDNNTFFYSLAKQLKEIRKGPAVLLNTSFNVAGQPIVETPKDAIETFLSTDIDYLSIENFWIEKKKTTPKNYKEHLKDLPDPITPMGLEFEGSSPNSLMKELDRALFDREFTSGNWTDMELRLFSAKYARYKELSTITDNFPLGKHFQSFIEEKAIVFLNPLGKSVIKSVDGSFEELSFSFADLKVFCLRYHGTIEELNKARIELSLSNREFEKKLRWAEKIIKEIGLTAQKNPYQEGETDSEIERWKECPDLDSVLNQFKDEGFRITTKLNEFHNVLEINGYNEKNVCGLLQINDLQHIQPTYLPYYEHFLLSNEPLENLIRLFLIRGVLSKEQISTLFEPEMVLLLCGIGVLHKNSDGAFNANVSIFPVGPFFIVTDHRFLFLEKDKITEDPVMYIGSDSFGLVQTAPHLVSAHTLDLCTGSGIQAISASRYSQCVTAIDINPRAVRFARFNAQLNKAQNVSVQLGSLYDGLNNAVFDTILANPPFVPSPNLETKFRDGGVNGEDVLREIVKGADQHLTSNGRLFIVTDLVDVAHYEKKLTQWWGNSYADTLILKTADRNEILFSVPHCHHPYNQTFIEYEKELVSWVQNFRAENLKAVNFGYVLLKKNDRETSYFCKTINNPSAPIHENVVNYFKNKEILRSNNVSAVLLSVSEGVMIKKESSLMERGKTETVHLNSPDSPYFCEYRITKTVCLLLEKIAKHHKVILRSLDNTIVKDLIQNGILNIEVAAGSEDFKDMESINEQITSEGDPKEEPLEKGAHLVEFETKTTPTCLSSYLKQ